MRFSIALMAVLLLMGGCAYFDEPGSKLILNLDNEFEIAMKENLLPQGRELRFVLTSIDDVKCDESELLLKSQTTGASVKISIDDILIPEACENGNSNPEGSAVFALRPTMYNMIIEVRDHTKQDGTLEVTDQSYELDLQETKGLIVENSLLNRIPDNFAWGYFQAKTAEQLSDVESFLSDHNLVTRPLANMNEGFYSYFTVDGEGIIHIEDLPSAGTVKKLAFNNINLTYLTTAVMEFKATHPDVILSLNLSDGSVL